MGLRDSAVQNLWITGGQGTSRDSILDEIVDFLKTMNEKDLNHLRAIMMQEFGLHLVELKEEESAALAGSEQEQLPKSKLPKRKLLRKSEHSKGLGKQLEIEWKQSAGSS